MLNITASAKKTKIKATAKDAKNTTIKATVKDTKDTNHSNREGFCGRSVLRPYNHTALVSLNTFLDI
ncbi:hypothetical protein HC776_01950 [bacterium]|nr:hypothetical protein [bacterium]